MKEYKKKYNRDGYIIDYFYPINDLTPVDKVLDKCFSNLGIAGKVHAFRAVQEYNYLDSEERMGSLAVNINKGKLIVETSNNATGNLLSMKKNHLAEKINEKIGKKVIKDIIFIVSKKGESQ